MRKLIQVMFLSLLVVLFIQFQALAKEYSYESATGTIETEGSETITLEDNFRAAGNLENFCLRFPASDGSCQVKIIDNYTGTTVVDDSTSGTCAGPTTAYVSVNKGLAGSYTITATVDNHSSASEDEVKIKMVYSHE